MLILALATVIVGLASGYLAGQFGLGGGVLTTPAIRLVLGYPPLIAVGTPLVVIIPTTISGAVPYVQAGLVDWGLVRRVAPVGIVAVVVGSFATKFVGGNAVLAFTGIVMLVIGARMLGRQRSVADEEQEGDAHHPFVAYAVGIAAGLFSGFLGLGGGVILIPAFVGPLERGMKSALGTSLVVVSLFALPGSVVHYVLGHIDLRLALLLTVGVIPGAWIGARVAIGANERVLRIAFGVFVMATAVVLMTTSILGGLR